MNNIISSETNTTLHSEKNSPQAHANNFFNKALAAHQQGNLDQAESFYRKVLSVQPDHLEACCFMALLLSSTDNTAEAVTLLEHAHSLAPEHPEITHQLGNAYSTLNRHQIACKYYQKTLSLQSDHWQAAFNLAATYFTLGKTREAIKTYNQAIRLNPQNADIYFNLGLAYKKSTMHDEAIDSYLCALELTPDDADIHYNLALAYKEMRCPEKSVSALEIAVLLRPDFAAAFGNLGVIYVELNKIKEAIVCYQRLIDLDHNRESAHHILAALTGQTTEAAPDSYIRELFDGFSNHFDQRLLHDLQYATPGSLKKILTDEEGSTVRYSHLLDLGCGTGLVGEGFKKIADKITGVDLSPKMLGKAAGKNIYDQIYEEEIVHFLAKTTQSFDLIVASDVLIYLGNLEVFFALLADRLTAKGKILISTEHLPTGTYSLQRSGRYAHSPDYIKNLAKDNNFKMVTQRRANLRKEKGHWIKGNLYLLMAS